MSFVEDGETTVTSETLAAPVGSPSASSSEATNSVPAERGRKVKYAPVRDVSFHALLGRMKTDGVALIGTTVSWRGSARGARPPVKLTENEPHCESDEKVILLNCACTAAGARTRKKSTEE